MAQKVTDRLATLFIDENLLDRKSLADNTNQFLESQLQAAKVRLIEQEKKLEEYRRQYSGQLPSQLTGNLQSVQAAQMQLQSLAESMNRARERRLLVERQVADAQSLPADMVAPVPPSSSPEAAAALPLPQRLDAAKARLDLYRQRYTADHPDVLALERMVADLEAELAQEAKKQPVTPGNDASVPRAELGRQKRVGDLQAELEVIDRQLASAQADEARLKKTIAEYQAKIEVVPTRESELVELTRDYATLQETYSSLLQKREDSKLAANLEGRQIGEQFKVLDAASLPERPSNRRQRLAVIFGGPLGGLALGLLVIGLLEYRDGSFRTEDDVVRVLELQVLALIPVMVEDEERAERQNKPPTRRRVLRSLKLPS
jgi:uncharacterized protein involved in exopolysaccharide biosynthesis